jgi:hypothetical protein
MLTTSTAQPHWETMTSHQEFATSMDPAFPLSAGRGKRSAMTLVIGTLQGGPETVHRRSARAREGLAGGPLMTLVFCGGCRISTNKIVLENGYAPTKPLRLSM